MWHIIEAHFKTDISHRRPAFLQSGDGHLNPVLVQESKKGLAEALTKIDTKTGLAHAGHVGHFLQGNSVHVVLRDVFDDLAYPVFLLCGICRKLPDRHMGLIRLRDTGLNNFRE